jgi:hypothetical protein
LLAVCNDWTVTPPGLIDPWVYFGYYQNLPRHLTLYDGTYYGTRLSTVLPGYAAYRCFPPIAANYVLRLGLFYACVISLYLILARTISPRAGLLAAVCLGGHFFFLRAIGSDYVDGFGIAYFFLSFLALTVAARSPFWKSSLVAAGACAAAFVIANVFYVVYLPSFVVHYLFLNRQGRRNRLLPSLGLSFLGAGGLTLALCLYNGSVTGRFWFLGPTLQFARTFAGQNNPWKAPVSSWLLGADWLVLPALTVLGAFCFFYRLRSASWAEDAERRRRTAVLYQVQFLGTLAMMIGWEWWGEPVLQPQEYASLLMPATLLALGAQLAPQIERLRARQFGVLVGMVFVILLAPHALNHSSEWLVSLSPWSGILTAAVGALGLAFLAFRRPGVKSAFGIVALFISIPTYVAWHTFDFAKTHPSTAFFQDGSPLVRFHYQASDLLHAVFDADQDVQRWDPRGHTPFWYHYRSPMGKVFTAVCSTYLWAHRLVNYEFPAVTDAAAFAALKGKRAFILSEDPQAVTKASAALDELGLQSHLLDEQHVAYPTIAFTISHVAITVKGVSEQPLTARFEQGADKGTLTVTSTHDDVALPPEKWRPCYDRPRMNVETTAEGLDVTTAMDRWAYALIYCRLRVVEEGNYRFDLKYSVKNGDIAFGALAEDQSRWIGQSGPGSAPPMLERPEVLVKSVSLHLKGGEGFRLLLTNNHPSGNHPSQVVVHEVRAFRETPTVERPNR